jgi:predicted anti-sigma-YlaC factor YlaD
MSENAALNAQWGVTDADEPLYPSLNNIDNESLATQEKERYKQDTRQRKFLARWVVWATSIWLGVVLVIIFFQGFSLITLDNTVVNVLLATTTVNVLGLAYIVLEGLFGKSKRRNSQE